MIIVEPRYPNKSRTITIFILVGVTFLAVLLSFLVRSGAGGAEPSHRQTVAQAAGLPEAAPVTGADAAAAATVATTATMDPTASTALESERAGSEREDRVAQVAEPDYDIIVRGGTLVGTYRLFGAGADVGIRNGLVYAIGDLTHATAAKVVDASGITYAVVDGHLAFASVQWTDATATKKEVSLSIVNREGGGNTTTVERSDGDGR